MRFWSSGICCRRPYVFVEKFCRTCRFLPTVFFREMTRVLLALELVGFFPWQRRRCCLFLLTSHFLLHSLLVSVFWCLYWGFFPEFLWRDLFERCLGRLECQGRTAIVWQFLFGQFVLLLEWCLSLPVELFF